MTGTVYVANYSWYFSPMWELAKRTLPQKALRIVTFVSDAELKTCIPEENVPKGITGSYDTNIRARRIFKLRVRLQSERRFTAPCQSSPGPNTTQHLVRIHLRGLLLCPFDAKSPSNDTTHPLVRIVESSSMAYELGFPSSSNRSSQNSILPRLGRHAPPIHLTHAIHWT
jgi:hypothetical protein